MITARLRLEALVTRLKRRTEVLAERRARQIIREARRSTDWRDAAALWPDFAEDQ